MTDPAPIAAATIPGSQSVRVRALLASAITSLLLAIFCGCLCYVAAGASLGLFFGTILLLTLVGPPLWWGNDWVDALIQVGALVTGTAIVWLTSASMPTVFLGDALRCLPVPAAYLLALAGAHALLVRCGFPALVAAALTTMTGLAWLSWPVWLSAALDEPHGQSIVSLLTPIDPLMGVNGVMRHFGAWDHVAPLAYKELTVLNQDVTYRLPNSVLPAVLFHGVLGGVLLGLSRLGRSSGRVTTGSTVRSGTSNID